MVVEKIRAQRDMRPSLSCKLYVFECAWMVRPILDSSGDDGRTHQPNSDPDKQVLVKFGICGHDHWRYPNDAPENNQVCTNCSACSALPCYLRV